MTNIPNTKLAAYFTGKLIIVKTTVKFEPNAAVTSLDSVTLAAKIWTGSNTPVDASSITYTGADVLIVFPAQTTPGIWYGQFGHGLDMLGTFEFQLIETK